MERRIYMGHACTEKPVHIDSIPTLYYFEFSDKFEDHIEQHEAWELVYIDRGHCNVIAGDRTLALQQGEMFFHKPGEAHMLQIPTGEYPNILIISFACSSPALMPLGGRVLRASLAVKQHIVAIIHDATETFDMSDRRLNIQGILFEHQNKLWAGEQSILLRLELMLIDLLREHVFCSKRESPFLTKELAADAVCRKIIDYLENHICEKLCIDALCEHVNFSRSYISKHFSRICGMSLVHYFNRMKIEEAKRLIRETRLSFFEISEKLSLSNSHYFSTLFKIYVGMTPSQYKKSCK